MASHNKILLTGATGYVGGTVLTQLTDRIKSERAGDQTEGTSLFKDVTIDVVVRGEDKAKQLEAAYGDTIRTIQWQGLEDVEGIQNLAAKYDIVVNTGSGFIPEGAKAFITGLAQRINKPDTPVPWLLHISGCTNLGDRPITQLERATPNLVLKDSEGAKTFAHLAAEDAREPYFQRTAEIGVLTAAADTGVQAVSLNTPLIFGPGTGKVANVQGIIIPTLLRYILTHGHGFTLHESANFDYVHVQDLADIYVRLVATILGREDRGVGYIPSGKSGLIFPTVGRASVRELTQRCLDALFERGHLPREDTVKEKEIRQVTLEEVAPEVAAGIMSMAEQGWAGNKAVEGTVAKELLGWKPSRLEEAFHQDFFTEVDELAAGRRAYTMDSCIGAK